MRDARESIHISAMHDHAAKLDTPTEKVWDAGRLYVPGRSKQTGNCPGRDLEGQQGQLKITGLLRAPVEEIVEIIKPPLGGVGVFGVGGVSFRRGSYQPCEKKVWLHAMSTMLAVQTLKLATVANRQQMLSVTS